jgi:adenosylhomocysteine nucleosidase
MFLRSLVTQWLRHRMGEQLREAAVDAVQHAAREAASETKAENPPPQTTLPPTECDVAFLFALAIEAGGLVDRVAERVTTRGGQLVEHVGRIGPRRVAIVETGVGGPAARASCRDMIAVRRPRWIVSAGFAGGLSRELWRGDMLMADHVADLSGRSLSVGLKLDAQTVASKRSLHVGRLLTVDRVIAQPAEKLRLGEEHSAVACDMESMAVAEVCREAKVRFLSVRTISDAADDELPPELEHLIQQTSIAGKLGAAAGAIFRDPKNAKKMWRLRSEALQLSDQLAKFLLGVLPQLE